MLSKDVKIVDIASDQLENIVSHARRGSEKRKDGILIFYEENRVVHAVHTRKGPIELQGFDGPRRLEAVAKAEDVAYVAAFERGGLRRVAASAQSRIRWDDPLILQGLALFGAYQKELEHTIHLYPMPRPAGPRQDARIVRWMRRLLKREQLFALIVYDDGGEGVWFSAITKWKDGECSLLTTTDSLGMPALRDMPETKRDQEVLDRIRAVWGAPAGALFLDRAVFAHCAGSARPLMVLKGALRQGWARARPFPLLWRAGIWAARWLNL